MNFLKNMLNTDSYFVYVLKMFYFIKRRIYALNYRIMPYPCIHVVTFALISILVPDYIQKRRGQVIKRRIFALNYRFSNKNDLVCAWREFHSTSCVLSTYYKGPARA